MATRSLLDRDGTTARQDDSASLPTPETRDFPMPSRTLRLGLGSAAPGLSTDNVSTTEITITRDDLPESAPAPETAKPKHRLQAPPAALRARTALLAIAAGATAMAVTGSAGDGASPLASAPSPAPLDDQNIKPVGNLTSDDTGPRALAAAPAADLTEFSAQLSQGTKNKKEQAAAEAAKRRPLVASPLSLGAYDLTSAFAPRWGTFHGGIDMAAPLGTPIHAATDGVVVKAEAASGYGHWIQVKASDGTITMYGHMASSGVLVKAGQKVTAGDTIGLVGNEGFSTGPHLHFEVWKPKGGSYVKVDPAPWLAKQGVRLSALGN